MSVSLHVSQAYGQAHFVQRKVAEDGENREESLILESASKEANYELRVQELQAELRQAKTAFASTQAENERLSGLILEIREVRNKKHGNEDIVQASYNGYNTPFPFFFLSFFLVLSSRMLSCWSCSAFVCETTSESIKSESLGCCRTTASWRRKTLSCRNKCPRSNRAR